MTLAVIMEHRNIVIYTLCTKRINRNRRGMVPSHFVGYMPKRAQSLSCPNGQVACHARTGIGHVFYMPEKH